MIEESIRVHDRYQFEIKLAYELESERQLADYDIEAYIYSARNLGLSPETYTKQDFYNDIQTYIRFKTPSVSLSEITQGEASPLARLAASIERLRESRGVDELASFEFRLKLFDCIVRSALRDHIDEITRDARKQTLHQFAETSRVYTPPKEMRRSDDEGRAPDDANEAENGSGNGVNGADAGDNDTDQYDSDDDGDANAAAPPPVGRFEGGEGVVTEYVARLRETAERFRALRSRIESPEVESKALLEFHFADEYLSLLIEDYTFRFLQRLRKIDPALWERSKPGLLEIVRAEVRYRQAARYPTIAAADSDNESFVYRRSVLKKYIENALFLNTRAGHEVEVVQQLLFGFAAGMAMLFAMSVIFYYQTRYGALSLPFFAAAIVSYMFKDRMKELIRGYLQSAAGNWLFDHKTFIYAAPTRKIGVCRESFDFINEARVPPEIARIRDRDHVTEIENELRGESVIRYRKRIRLFPKWMRRIHDAAGIEGINDIIRMNVHRYLLRMDEPRKPIYVCDDGGYRRIRGRRTYNINMVIRDSSAGRSRYRRFRIVLNRNGIKRIEEVATGS